MTIRSASCGEVVLALERQAELLNQEAVEVRVEQRERVAGQHAGEAGLAQTAEDGVVVGQGRVPGPATRVHQPDSPGVAPQHGRADRDRDRISVVQSPRLGQVELGEDCVDHPVEQVLLVAPRGGRATSPRRRAVGPPCASTGHRARRRRRGRPPRRSPRPESAASAPTVPGSRHPTSS